jgi:hypothetical protein
MPRSIARPFLVVVAMTLAFTLCASADTILTLTSPAPANQQYQQTANSPCVFGDPSCKQPSGFNLTSIAGGGSLQDWGTTALGGAISSPTYTGQQILDAVGTNFLVGIDVNQAQHLSPILTYFAEFINGVQVAHFGTDGATTGSTLILTNNGNGYADAILTGFVAPQAGDTVVFKLTYVGANDGTEEFFLINTSSPPPVVPEPSSLVMLGTGLIGAATAVRKKFFL